MTDDLVLSDFAKQFSMEVQGIESNGDQSGTGTMDVWKIYNLGTTKPNKSTCDAK